MEKLFLKFFKNLYSFNNTSRFYEENARILQKDDRSEWLHEY